MRFQKEYLKGYTKTDNNACKPVVVQNNEEDSIETGIWEQCFDKDSG